MQHIKINESPVSWENIEDNIKNCNYRLSIIINSIKRNNINTNRIKSLSRIFEDYYSNLKLLSNMENFSNIFKDLSDFFRFFNLEEIERKKIERFYVYLYIYDDLVNFFDIVFINRECRDTNYLTDSLKSSIEQMKNELTSNKLEEKELELF